jgi:hypothetical protein
MSGVNFLITYVFDLEGRGGLLVAGRLLSGSVAGGTELRDAASGRPVRVLGVELHSGADPDRATLVVDRRDAEHVQAGRYLIGGADADDAGAD